MPRFDFLISPEAGYTPMPIIIPVSTGPTGPAPPIVGIWMGVLFLTFAVGLAAWALDDLLGLNQPWLVTVARLSFGLMGAVIIVGFATLGVALVMRCGS